MDREKLLRAGIDYESGVHRFAGNPQLYEKYLQRFFDKCELPALRRALEGGDYEAAFRAAHNMKGGAGNLSVSEFFCEICALVDELRAGVRGDSLLARCERAERLYEAAREAVKENGDG